MTNKNIDLPSQRTDAFNQIARNEQASRYLNMIEGPLRREVSHAKKCCWILPVIFGLVLGATASYFAVAHQVDTQKARADKAIQEDNNFYYSFCEQARNGIKNGWITFDAKGTKNFNNLCGE